MAIEHLLNVPIKLGKEIAAHPEATHYYCESGQVKFYRVNPKPSEKLRAVPKGTNTVRFTNYHASIRWIHYGNVEFINHQGNILRVDRYG